MVTKLRNSWTKIPDLSEFTISVPITVSNWLFSLGLIEQENVIDIQLRKNCLPPAIIVFKDNLQEMLKQGLGVVRIQLEAELDDHELRYLYAGISSLIGELNDKYGFFFDVVDHGLDYKKEAIPVSKTNAETGYHTDSTAKNYFPDIVGLLCLQPAKTGGDSLIVNACNVYTSILREKEEWMELLHFPLFRDVITPGAEQTIEQIKKNDFPLFEIQNDELLFRYMRYWIESAYAKLGEDLPYQLKDVLDYIDAYFSEPANVLKFRMERGDILYVNNRFLCHNRTEFMDGGTPRKLVRTWINT